MSDPELSNDEETKRVGRRFTDFVINHSQEATPVSPKGEVRVGKFAVRLEGQLIPVDRVTFEQYTTDEDSETPIPENIGTVISLSDGDVERYSIVYIYDRFHESEEDFGIDFDRVIDPARATSLLASLEEAERTGKLTAIIP